MRFSRTIFFNRIEYQVEKSISVRRVTGEVPQERARGIFTAIPFCDRSRFQCHELHGAVFTADFLRGNATRLKQ